MSDPNLGPPPDTKAGDPYAHMTEEELRVLNDQRREKYLRSLAGTKLDVRIARKGRKLLWLEFGAFLQNILDGVKYPQYDQSTLDESDRGPK